MRIGEFLAEDGVLATLEVQTFEEVLLYLLEGLSGGEGPPEAVADPEVRLKWARDLAFGSRGEIARFHDDVVLVGTEIEGVAEAELRVALLRDPVEVTGEGREEPATARLIFFVVAPRRLSSVLARVAPVLRRIASTDLLREALLDADSPEEVREVRGFLDVEIPKDFVVQSALEPVTWRVYPETPIREVLDLMARRRLHAVPVVGDEYEVLGIITSGDALGYLVPRARTGSLEEAASDGLARDIMSRSVLCVTEEQPLRDVAAQLVNRDVEQMPVVREGELIGFVTRDTVLRTLFGPSTDHD